MRITRLRTLSHNSKISYLARYFSISMLKHIFQPTNRSITTTTLHRPRVVFSQQRPSRCTTINHCHNYQYLRMCDFVRFLYARINILNARKRRYPRADASLHRSWVCTLCDAHQKGAKPQRHIHIHTIVYVHNTIGVW